MFLSFVTVSGIMLFKNLLKFICHRDGGIDMIPTSTMLLITTAVATLSSIQLFENLCISHLQ